MQYTKKPLLREWRPKYLMLKLLQDMQMRVLKCLLGHHMVRAAVLICVVSVGACTSQRILADDGDARPVTRHELEAAAAAAINWLGRHQFADGHWSFKDYTKLCKDDTCTGPGTQESLSAATALGLLPLLAGGQTHTKDGPYKNHMARGIDWLVKHQKPDGDLSAGATQQMYSHGFAAIALCETYSITKDTALAAPAQRAIDFIEDAQNSRTGGWRYYPGEEGDTSVLGWQVTALKSAQLAGLKVKPSTLEGAKKWLASVSKADGDHKPTGHFAYLPGLEPTPTMSAVGILCSRHLGVAPSDPLIVAGVDYLAANPPDTNARNVYYWFCATETMQGVDDAHRVPWINRLRRNLVDSQVHEGCAAGSWSPDKPQRDAWGPNGGRLMMTSFSCLSLEVYYRYLPVFKATAPLSDAARQH